MSIKIFQITMIITTSNSVVYTILMRDMYENSDSAFTSFFYKNNLTFSTKNPNNNNQKEEKSIAS